VSASGGNPDRVGVTFSVEEQHMAVELETNSKRLEAPPASHPVWREIVTGKTKFAFEFLAAKILLGRLTYQVKKDPSPKTIAACAQALRDLYAENTVMPCVQNDLNQMYGGDKS
jgi:hypothetical protein